MGHLPLITPRVHYVAEPHVDAALDAALRRLLAQCFDKPTHPRFSERRYAFEMPQHRFLVFDADELVAHAGVHEKLVHVADVALAVWAVCEVCVHPRVRRSGLVKSMLAMLHSYAPPSVDFTVLFGSSAVYASSGYVSASALVRWLDPVLGTASVRARPDFLWRAEHGQRWPDGLIDLNGPEF